jgi:hypothetical protein
MLGGFTRPPLARNLAGGAASLTLSDLLPVQITADAFDFVEAAIGKSLRDCRIGPSLPPDRMIASRLTRGPIHRSTYIPSRSRTDHLPDRPGCCPR